jgi:hypothetical protein
VLALAVLVEVKTIAPATATTPITLELPFGNHARRAWDLTVGADSAPLTFRNFILVCLS